MILDQMRSASDLKQLPRERLPELCTEIRRVILDTVTRNGGHLGSSMGVVELTVALHRIYDFPHDRLFLDTGHQCYPHKLLTGRFDRFATLRQKGGLSGFPNKDESRDDLMTSGHAGTAISMALGACVGDALAPAPEPPLARRRTVAVVGDASIVSGMSLEALNNAGHSDRDLLIILNDNEQSIGRTVGALSRVLSKVRMSKLYSGAKHAVEKIEALLSRIPRIGERMEKSVHEFAEHLKHVIAPGQVLDALGFRYFGIFDGHDLDGMLEVLQAMRNQPGMKLLHVLTVKGKGVKGCETDPLALHGAKPGDAFVLEGDGACKVDKVASAPAAAKKGPPKVEFAKCLSEVLLQEAERDPRICAITAGMPDGTGLRPFSERFADRFFNVGIAEQHAVGFASGLTIGGRRPVCAIYSTFLQRGYDQVFQEVALQRNPVLFVLSHGGLAGDDGPTHHGLFDIAFLRVIPGIVLLSPRDGAELQEMFRFALAQPGPVAIRYPKAQTAAPGRGVAPIELGKAELLREGEEVALVGYGPMAETALEAAALLEKDGCSCTVVNARFARPLDELLYARLLADHRLVVTLEEAAVHGGFGSALLEFAARQEGAHGSAHARIWPMGVPDRFIEHGARAELLHDLGLTATGVRDAVLGLTRETAFFGTAAG